MTELRGVMPRSVISTNIINRNKRHGAARSPIYEEEA